MSFFVDGERRVRLYGPFRGALLEGFLFFNFLERGRVFTYSICVGVFLGMVYSK